MHNLVHALVRCFRDHGGTLMLNAPVAKVTWAAGRPDGVVLEEDSAFGPREIKARKAVVMHTSPPIALKMLGNDEVAHGDGELQRKMNHWGHDRSLRLHFLLPAQGACPLGLCLMEPGHHEMPLPGEGLGLLGPCGALAAVHQE